MDAIPTVSKAENVAQRILDNIIKNNLVPGVSIGTEAELVEQFNVSRPTLRESLRVLESQGILELRPGPKGGIILRKPSIHILAHALSVYLMVDRVPYLDVIKAREVIEPGLAAEAALNGTEEDFVAMEQSIERMKNVKAQDAFIAENRFFHQAIAQASGNKVLEAFWGSISALADGVDYGVKLSESNQQHVVAAHQGILDACRARDPRLAGERMGIHVSALEHLVRKRYKELINRPTRVFNRMPRS